MTLHIEVLSKNLEEKSKIAFACNSLPMSCPVATTPKQEKFPNIFGWWLGFCFVIGLPFGKTKKDYLAKMFTFIFLTVDVIIGVKFLYNVVILSTHENPTTYTTKLTSIFFPFFTFLFTTGLHTLLVWKGIKIRRTILELIQLLVVDNKGLKLLKVAMLLFMAFTAAQVVGMIAFTTIVFTGLNRNSLKAFNAVLWAFHAFAYTYPVVMAYTVTLLLIALGSQFQMLHREMEARSSISWQQLYERHLQLCQMAGKIQDCFSLPLAMFFSIVLVHFCVYYFTSLTYLLVGNYSPISFVLIFLIFGYFMNCFCLCAAADYLSSQANSLGFQLAKSDLAYLNNLQEKDGYNSSHVIRGISINVRNLESFTNFSLCGFCRMGKSLLLPMSATVITYAVLLCQTSFSERN